MQAYVGTIVVRYPAGFVNKNADDWIPVRTGDLRVDQLNSVVDCDLLGNFAHAIRNRFDVHANCRPKEKVGANPPDKTSALPSKLAIIGKGNCIGKPPT